MSDKDKKSPLDDEGRSKATSLETDDLYAAPSPMETAPFKTGPSMTGPSSSGTPFRDTYRRDIIALASALDSDLVPTVLAGTPPADAAPRYPYDRDVQETLRLLLQGKRDVALDYLNRLREQGADVRDIFMHVLTPAAYRLGHLWEEDRLDFLTVTDATGLLISLMRGLVSGYSRFQAPIAQPEATARSINKNMLVLTRKGEDHYFGALMLAEFFRFEGFDVVTLLQANGAEIEDHVKTRMVDCVAYSISTDLDLADLNDEIDRVRKASTYQGILVCAGGYFVNSDPARARQINVDFTAQNGAQAVDELNKQLRLRRVPGHGFTRSG